MKQLCSGTRHGMTIFSFGGSPPGIYNPRGPPRLLLEGQQHWLAEGNRRSQGNTFGVVGACRGRLEDQRRLANTDGKNAVGHRAGNGNPITLLEVLSNFQADLICSFNDSLVILMWLIASSAIQRSWTTWTAKTMKNSGAPELRPRPHFEKNSVTRSMDQSSAV